MAKDRNVKKSAEKKRKAMTFEIEDGELVIRCPLPKAPRESGSGKSLVYASTNGNMDTGLEIDGEPLIIGLNAYCKK